MSATDARSGREKILRMAEELFLDGGYAAVSIRDIARACELSNAAIYHHFTGKEELFLAILKRLLDRYQVLLKEAAQGETWLERLASMSLRMGKAMVEERMTIRALLASASHFSLEEATAMLTQIREQLVAPFAQILDEGVASGDIRPMDTSLGAWVLIGMISTAGHPFIDSTPDPDRVRFALDLFVHGILSGSD